MTGGKIIDYRQGDMIEVTIIGEKVEETEIVRFTDVLTDHTEIVTQVHRIMMIHIERLTIIQMVQTDLLCTLIPTALEGSLGEVGAKLKLYKKKAMLRLM